MVKSVIVYYSVTTYYLYAVGSTAVRPPTLVPVRRSDCPWGPSVYDCLRVLHHFTALSLIHSYRFL